MKKIINILFVAFAIFSSASCVKESREHCPCYLNFAHDGFCNNGYLDNLSLYVVEEGGRSSMKTYRVEDMITDDCFVEVKRGDLNVYGLVGLSTMVHHDEHFLTIPYGQQCDSIMSFYDRVAAHGERAKVYGAINKLYARVKMTIKFPDVEGKVVVKVVGNTCGLDMRTTKGLKGPFMCLAEHLGHGLHTFRVPRQSDNSLILEIWEVPADSSADTELEEGRKLSFLNLGEMVTEKLEYDWNEEYLADIDLDVDFVKSIVTISIKDWDRVEIFDMDI